MSSRTIHSVFIFFLFCLSSCGGGGGGDETGEPAAGPGPESSLLPIIQSFSPSLDVQAIPGTQVTFQVEVLNVSEDLNFFWYVDWAYTENSSSWLVLNTSEQDPAERTVEVHISNGGEEFTALVWKLHLLNDPSQNSPPSITAAFPPGSLALNAGEILELSVVALDPDPGDTLTYIWSIDSWPGTEGGNTYLLKTENLSAGDHQVTVTVHDEKRLQEASILFTWIVEIRNDSPTNRPPLIVYALPDTPIRLIAGSSLELQVEAQDLDGDPLTFSWEVDGLQRPEKGSTLKFQSNGLNPGLHSVRVTAEDGSHQISDAGRFEWPITVVAEEFPSGTGSISIAWDAVTTDINGNTENVRGYLVYLGESPESFRLFARPGISTQVTLNKLISGARYYIAVSAYDANGNEGALSTPLPVVIP